MSRPIKAESSRVEAGWLLNHLWFDVNKTYNHRKVIFSRIMSFIAIRWWVGVNSKHAYLQLIFGREKEITHPTRRDNQPVELSSWSLCCYSYWHCVAVVISIVIIIVWPNIFISSSVAHLYYYITNVSLNQNQCKGTSRVVAWFRNGRYDLNHHCLFVTCQAGCVHFQAQERPLWQDLCAPGSKYYFQLHLDCEASDLVKD